MFLNLLRATRLERALIPVSYIMISVAFADKISVDIFFLILSCFLMYSVGGLINAKVDKDYSVNYLFVTAWIFLSLSLLLSLYNFIITITVVISFFLGFIYSKYSRFFLFGDSLILSVTHIAIPMISSSFILGVFSEICLLVPYLMFALVVIAPMKNLSGVAGDKSRGYKTLMTFSGNGKLSTHVLMKFYFLIVFSMFFLFDLSSRFLLIVFILFFIQIIMDVFMGTGREVEAYGLVRLVIIMLPIALVFDKSANLYFLSTSIALANLYFLYYVVNFRGIAKNGI